MNLVENKLLIDEKIEYDDYKELLELVSSDDIEEIIVETNDIHPSIFQLLFVLSKDKKITVEDEFNKRFFDNLKLAS
ncbi:MAG: hypothetical protein U9R16_03725 [Campylobacterota bacterium]|nr:hypothetical protein [Campylobacterota bacterium]